MKVLIIDDEADICFILSYEINSKGHASVSFQSALAAQNYLLTENVDVVVCDYQMPGMNGLEFFHWLQENGRPIPFILLTGGTYSESVFLKEKGITEVLIKPSGVKDIGTILNKISSDPKI